MAFADITCGTPIAPLVQVTDMKGNVFPFFVTDTDDALGVVDMTVQAQDYVPGVEFLINIETDAPIAVRLASGNDFMITQAQATAYLGQWYPAKLIRVLKSLNGVTTTGTFSVGK